jgi:hypothetical protein
MRGVPDIGRGIRKRESSIRMMGMNGVARMNGKKLAVFICKSLKEASTIENQLLFQ